MDVLNLVADKIKNKVLFPKKVKSAKKYLETIEQNSYLCINSTRNATHKNSAQLRGF